MPITLAKLFSDTVSSSFEYDGETVHIEWSPSRYTGEMDDYAAARDEEAEADSERLAEALEERDQKAVKDQLAVISHKNRLTTRRFLAALLVTWDVLDEKGKPIPTDDATLAKLPPEFLQAVFHAIGQENQPDPTKPDPSHATSAPKASPAPSRRGSGSSAKRTTSASRRGN